VGATGKIAAVVFGFIFTPAVRSDFQLCVLI